MDTDINTDLIGSLLGFYRTLIQPWKWNIEEGKKIEIGKKNRSKKEGRTVDREALNLVTVVS